VFSQEDFSTEAYLELKRNLKIELTHSYLKALNAKPNEKLYEQLLNWREITAKAENVMPNMILTEKTAAIIAEKLPVTLKALSGIKGVGPEKSSRYGAAILTVVRAYQQEVSGAADQGSLF
jgi:superfamily II DNA helicase RecQ